MHDSRVCPWWLAYTFDNPFRRFLHDPRQMLGALVREGMTAADIGCGMGYFSISLAGMVGPKGFVVAVDLQQKMLDVMLKRAQKAGVAGRIRPVRSSADDIGIAGPVDFALAFWMVHEVKDVPRFFGQISTVLKKGGTVLCAEPKIHVSEQRFREILGYARQAGFSVEAAPLVRFSRAALLVRMA